MSQVQFYLRSIVSLMSEQRKANRPMLVEEFLLRHGRSFPISKQPCPKKFRGPMKQCFHNAATVALSNPRYTYCEGFALSMLPVWHGWLLSPGGKVIDPTWDDGEEYFGIPFRREYLIDDLNRTLYYGVLYTHNYRPAHVLTQPPKEFKHAKYL